MCMMSWCRRFAIVSHRVHQLPTVGPEPSIYLVFLPTRSGCRVVGAGLGSQWCVGNLLIRLPLGFSVGGCMCQHSGSALNVLWTIPQWLYDSAPMTATVRGLSYPADVLIDSTITNILLTLDNCSGHRRWTYGLPLYY